MLLGFLELQQKWGHVEEGEAGWSLWPEAPVSQGAAGSGLTFMYADREGKLTDLGGCMCDPLLMSQGPCVWGSTSRAQERVCWVLWWWLCSDSQVQSVTPCLCLSR